MALILSKAYGSAGPGGNALRKPAKNPAGRDEPLAEIRSDGKLLDRMTAATFAWMAGLLVEACA